MINIDPLLVKKSIIKSARVNNFKALKENFSKINSLSNFHKFSIPFIFEKLFVNYRKKNRSFIHYLIETVIFVQKFLFFTTSSLNPFRKKNLNLEEKIFFFSNKLVDQYNVFPISNYLLNKRIRHSNLISIENKNVFTLLKYGFTPDKQGHLKKLQKKYKNNLISINNIIEFKDIIYGILNYKKKKEEINKLFKILKLDNYQKRSIKNFYVFFFIYLEFYKRVLKEKDIRYIFSHYYNSPELCSLVYFLKSRKSKYVPKIFAYEFIGLGGESATYLYTNVDVLFVPNKLDILLSKKLENNDLLFFDFPKLIEVGSVRKENMKHIEKKIWEKGKLKILYIKSRSEHYNFIDDKALEMFARAIKRFEYAIDFKIKDRPDLHSKSVEKLKKLKIISKKQVILKANELVENYIHNADICVGTCSSAFTKQAIWFGKPLIQIFKKKLYRYQLDGAFECNNFNDAIFLLEKFLNQKFLNEAKKKSKNQVSKIFKKNKKSIELILQNLEN